MPTLALPAIRLALGLVTELRIDVNHTPDEVESELDAIRNRMSRSSDRLYGLPEVRTDIPGLVLRHREADGEYYVYVVDLRRDRVAGYTVFNRLIEVGRRADPYLRAPHSKYAAPYQRMGLATAVYRWGWTRTVHHERRAPVGRGASAVAGLARDYELGYVDLRRKRLSYLGRAVDAAVLGDLHTRMVLLGRGWTLERHMQATGMTWSEGARTQQDLG